MNIFCHFKWTASHQAWPFIIEYFCHSLPKHDLLCLYKRLGLKLRCNYEQGRGLVRSDIFFVHYSKLLKCYKSLKGHFLLCSCQHVTYRLRTLMKAAGGQKTQRRFLRLHNKKLLQWNFAIFLQFLQRRLSWERSQASSGLHQCGIQHPTRTETKLTETGRNDNRGNLTAELRGKLVCLLCL